MPYVVRLEKVCLSAGEAAIIDTGRIFHRRSHTRSALHTRITFNVDVALRGASNFKCVDSSRAEANGCRLATQEYIDDLSEQDVFLDESVHWP